MKWKIILDRASREIELRKPSYEECAQYYINHLLKTILEDKNNAIEVAYEVYEVSREQVILKTYQNGMELVR